MPGTYITPMTWNRRWWIDLSANDSPQWAEVSVGITSRGNSINEQSQEYYDMAGRGVAVRERACCPSRTMGPATPKTAKTSASASRSWALPKRELLPSVRTARPRFRRRPQRQRRRRNERGV